jgi:hypothetical protein
MTTVTATTTKTVQDRFTNAVKASRQKNKFRVRVNVMGCCRSCISAEREENDTRAYAYAFGGQGMAYTWFEGEMFYRETVNKMKRRHYAHASVRSALLGSASGRVKVVYFNFDTVEVAQSLREAFEAEGFTVEWNGTEEQCVQVVMP